eukprot:612166-Alexandrium_andersonii.AAC.1
MAGKASEVDVVAARQLQPSAILASAADTHARRSYAGARQTRRQPHVRHQARVPRCGGAARCRQARNQQ